MDTIQRTCIYCGGTDGVEYVLDTVWRQDRAKTAGSRTVEANRPVRLEFACKPCVSLKKKGNLSAGQEKFDL